MDLDDLASFAQIDAQNMLSHIDNLPDQLEGAWKLGSELDLPDWTGIHQVIVAGMGGSAIGADLLAAYAAPTSMAPIAVQRDYGLPAWAAGPQTLVIASSHSGNTEETLDAFAEARRRGCKCLAVTTGGALGHAASQANIPLWQFDHSGQPRAAVGFSFGLLLAALARLGLLADPQTELDEAVAAMRRQQERFFADVPAALNPAKRYAGQLMGRFVAVFASGLLAPVARRWKTQINEIAKVWAQFEFLPEADHNALEACMEPRDSLAAWMILFLQSPSDHPRNRLRSELTRKSFMLEGLNTDFINAQGDAPLANMWTCLHMGDYVAYYLAMAYGIDPTPVPHLQAFKEDMKTAG